MSLVAVDGFDLYNGTAAPTSTAPSTQLKWSQLSSSGLSLVAGRFGGQAFRIAGSGQVSRALTSARTATANGLAMRWNTLPGVGAVAVTHIGYLSGVTVQFTLRVTPAGAIEVYRGNTATLLGSTLNGLIAASAWNYLEIETTISTTTGTVTLYLNGISVLALTAVNNAAAGAGSSVNGFVLGSANGNFAGSVDFDDYYEADTNTKIGEGRVETLRPSADTATKNWTPDTGVVNFSRINETLADGDTSYVQASTVGTLDLYSFGSLSSSPSSILGVQVASFASKTDAATRDIANSVKSGATSSDGGNFALAASYSKFERMLTTDPNTSAAWTAANVNALQAGPKVTV